MKALVKTSKPSRAETHLAVQVYQGPALQCEGKFPLRSPRSIRVGKSADAHLSIPFGAFPTDLNLFTIDKWGAKIHLDPRLEGFVSDGQRFGSVRDFIAPRGALKELATILEPLDVPIPLGSRGAIEFNGYTIVFRVAQPKPPRQVDDVKGAPKAPFDLPYGQTMFEKSGFLLGMLSTVLIAIPGIIWLNRFPFHKFEDIRDLPPLVAAELIHPDHFQILPWALGEEFDGQNMTREAVRWVDELRKKWQAEELGQVYESNVPVLRGFSVPEDIGVMRSRWQKELDEQWRSVALRRETAAPGTFLRGQSAYTPFRVVVSGGESGSIHERVRQRLARLDRTHTAAVSMIATEHDYMKSYFKEQSAEIPEIFDPPREPGLFFRLAENSFTVEKNNFRLAESFAALARREQNLVNSADEVQGQAQKTGAQPLVWSGDSLVIANVLSLPQQSILSGSEDQLFRNAQLAMGKIAPPPAPKPIPKINMTEVESFVRSRSPEVKVCYDAALNRDPRVSGVIQWQWTIAESGKLARVRVEKSTIRDPSFIGCLEKKIKGWSFPKPVNGAITISFPFRFVVRENIDTLERISR